MTNDQTFRRLHEDGLLVLPNAWDAGSARLIESRGAKAIATTSAGLAWSCGYADGDTLPVERLLGAIAAIARVIKVPLTADAEGGYSDDPAAVADVLAAVVEAGAVGVNLEDGGHAPELLCAKVAAVRERVGAGLFINVRTDVCLRGLVPADEVVGEVTRRAALYRAAGGDGLFVPGLRDPDQIRAVAAAVRPTPVNIMLVAGLPSHAELQALGVRRLSAGAAIAEAALGLTGRLTDELLAGGDDMFEGAADYGALNRLFTA